MCFLLFLFEILFFANADAILRRPYKVFVLKTEHFDIIFPQKSRSLAEFLGNEVDSLYAKASDVLNSSVNIRMPIVISPDSDEMSVTYTPYPYNRIIIFDAPPLTNSVNDEPVVLSKLYKEIFKAVLQSTRSKFNTFIANTIGGNSYQPVSQLNMPFSFIEGICFLSENFYANEKKLSEISGEFEAEGTIFQEENINLQESFFRLNDTESLQVLVQAKIENKFPNSFQVRISNDIYPYDKVNLAAATGFAAYLLQSRGIEKYTQLWQESGKLNLFFTDGVFLNVYKESLKNLWQEFYDAVPLPEDLEQMKKLEENATEFLQGSSEGLYRNVVFSDYGIIWYDEIKHEVDIFNDFDNFENPFAMRNLLFLANDIDKLSLSTDSRYLTVSFKEIKNRDEFKIKVCWIYDLQEHCFLKQKFNLEAAALFVSSDKNLNNFNNLSNLNYQDEKVFYIAGINIEEKKHTLQVFSFFNDDKEGNLIYERDFLQNEIPQSVTFSPDGKLCILISQNYSQKIRIFDFMNNEEQDYALEFVNDGENETNNIKVLNLRTAKTSVSKVSNMNDDFVYMFDYYLQDSVSFVRTGIIKIDENGGPKHLYFMNEDLIGGMYDSCLHDNKIYFSSHKTSNDELKYIEKNEISFIEGNIVLLELEIYEQEEVVSQKKEERRYNPAKYLFPFSVMPMLPVKEVSVEDGAILWPGVGATFVSQADPFENTQLMFSAGWTFAKLNFEAFLNPSKDYENDRKVDELLEKKDKSAALFIKNSSTPVDISFGNIFRFNLDGEYLFKGIIGTSWQIPLGMNFSNMKIGIESEFTASTDYYDSNLIYQNQSLSGWPSFSSSYELFKAIVTTEYSNIHQYGLSVYEKRGFSLALRMYSIWDVHQTRILTKYMEEQNELIKINGENYHLTEAQLKEAVDARMLAISQINLGISAKIEIPRLTPLKITNGWVLSLPASITARFFYENGTAISINPEILLIGNEIHNGFSLLQLYFGRVGLKAGYNLNFKYDTSKVLKPDIRRENYMGEILANTYLDESFYLLLNIDFTTSLGFSTSSMFSLENKIAYYPRSNGFLYSFSFVARF